MRKGLGKWSTAVGMLRRTRVGAFDHTDTWAGVSREEQEVDSALFRLEIHAFELTPRHLPPTHATYAGCGGAGEDWMGWDVMGWDVVGWDVVGRDVVGWDRVGF